MSQPESDPRPLVTVIIPAYNEEALLEKGLEEIERYLVSTEDEYRWEMIVINDGSQDATGEIAARFAGPREHVRALNHPRNFGLGQALKFGFANSRGDYVVTLDVDLSYDVRHVGELLAKIRESHAKIVIASPYMKGGSIRNVPLLRRTLSILANKFLASFVRGRFSTLTSMVRIYDGPFIRSLDLRAMGMAVMPETLYKALVLRASIDEIPGRLDWGPQLEAGEKRRSSMRVARHVLSTVMSGFIFRPFVFFVVPGLVIGAFALYVDFWMFAHYFEALVELKAAGTFTWSAAFALAYERFPHTYVTALLSTMLAIQLVGLGVLALQSKRYYEELFHLGSSRLQELRRRPDEPGVS
jgi:glycosyltransferase involved in cell wall biosynthesis